MLEFLLSSFGATFILTKSKLFSKIRPKHHFFHCPLCVGFWVGFLFSFWFGGLSFFMACASSGTSYLLSMFGLKLENNINETN